MLLQKEILILEGASLKIEILVERGLGLTPCTTHISMGPTFIVTLSIPLLKNHVIIKNLERNCDLGVL